MSLASTEEFSSATVVRLKNIGDNPWKDKYGNQPFQIPPGGEIFAPYGAMKLWLGDPTLIDFGKNRMPRNDEYKRLRQRYGVHSRDERMDTNFPKLECYSIDGERILTVLDDPTGETLTPVKESIRQREQLESALAQTIARQKTQEAQIQLLKQQLNLEDQDIGEDRVTKEKLAAPIIIPQTVQELMAEMEEETAMASEDTPEKIPVGKPTQPRVIIQD